MLPPTIVWKPAPMVPKIDLERTMMPRTIPKLRVILKPSNWKAVVTRSWVMDRLFHAKGGQWVHVDCAAGWYPARHKCHGGHESNRTNVGEEIARADSVKNLTEEFSGCQ